MDDKRRLFRIYDENEKEIGHGVYFPNGESVQVYFDGVVHRGVGIGQVLCSCGVVRIVKLGKAFSYRGCKNWL